MATAEGKLQRRVAAAQGTLDFFRDKPMRLGSAADCVRMTAHHLRRMGRSITLPPVGAYRTPKSAKQALVDRGFADLLEAMDSLRFPRIPAAAAIVGDVLALPGEADFGGALTVSLGNGRVIGFHEDVKGAVVLQPLDYICAWRIDPQ